MLVDFIDPKQYSQLTVTPALKNVAKLFDWPYEIYQPNLSTSEKGVIVFAAAQMHIGRVSTKHLRQQFPNFNLVCLGSDTIYYLKRSRYEFDTPLEVDLYLDLLDEVVDYYRRLGITTDSWMWTASDTIVLPLLKRPIQPKVNDFIGLFQVKGDVRQALWNSIESEYKKNIKGNRKVGHMAVNFDVENLYKAYSSTRFTLGTTSASWKPNKACRTMKGFRDWLGPACGSVLIYDAHPDVIRKYPCPLYNYDKPREILDLVKNVLYDNVLQIQREWLVKNTLERQFVSLFVKHGII